MTEDSPEIREVLNTQYGIHNSKISVGPRQFVAETFIVQLEDSKKYFLKIVTRTETPRKIIGSLPALKYLIESGLNNISVPVQTSNGDLYFQDEKYIYVLFEYIEGKQGFGYDGRLLAQFMSKLHHIKPVAEFKLVEKFSSYVDELFPKIYKEMWEYEGDDAVILELKETLAPYQRELDIDWELFKRIANECKGESTDQFVFTHGDAPGNVMKKDNEIFVIDWDDIMLAPPERDIWFLKEGNNEFMDEYIKHNPEFRWNNKFYSYYVLWRNFDDLFGWFGEILGDGSQEERAEMLNNLKDDWFNWLRPAVRAL